MRSTHAFDDGLTWGPALSPDGRRIAFLRYTDNATWYDVYVANIDGSGVQHVTRFPLQEGPPTWTPDGRGVVMTVSAADGILQDVYMQSPVLDSPDRTQLTNFTVGAEGSLVCPIILDNKTPVAISRHGMMAFACQFGEIDVLASDGTRLAFIETTSDSATNYALVGVAVKVMDADGGNVVTIATTPSTAAAGGWVGPNNLSLCWMADGSRVVFNVPESELVGHLWVAKADGSGLAKLTSAPGAWDRSVSCSR